MTERVCEWLSMCVCVCVCALDTVKIDDAILKTKSDSALWDVNSQLREIKLNREIKIKIAITFFYSVAETGFHRYEQLNKQSSYKVNNYTANLLDTKKYLQMG